MTNKKKEREIYRYFVEVWLMLFVLVFFNELAFLSMRALDVLDAVVEIAMKTLQSAFKLAMKQTVLIAAQPPHKRQQR